MVKVFAVVVTYNSLQWIENCLNSILNSSVPVIPLVIDNNSTDDTIGFIKINFPDLILLEQSENLGFGKANNIGISYALNHGADGVFLLNQDAYVQKTCIENLIKAYEENSCFGIISPIHMNGDGSAVDMSFLKVVKYLNSSQLLSDMIIGKFSNQIYETDFINAAAWFIPRYVLLKVGGFDPMFFLYGEDDNYCQRVLFHKYKIGICPNSVVFHDSANDNYKLGIPGSKKYFRQFKSSVYAKYLNINDSHKMNQLENFKLSHLKKAIFYLITFRIKTAEINYKKFQMIDTRAARHSIELNKTSGPHYLDVTN